MNWLNKKVKFKQVCALSAHHVGVFFLRSPLSLLCRVDHSTGSHWTVGLLRWGACWCLPWLCLDLDHWLSIDAGPFLIQLLFFIRGKHCCKPLFFNERFSLLVDLLLGPLLECLHPSLQLFDLPLLLALRLNHRHSYSQATTSLLR